MPPEDGNLEEESSDGTQEMLTNVRAGLENVSGVFRENDENRKIHTPGNEGTTPFDKLWEEAECELYLGCSKLIWCYSGLKRLC